VPAIVLGGIGLSRAPAVGEGRAHAWTAIVAGVASIVVWGGDRLGWWSLPIRDFWGI
jgi:hypothetical protein